MPRQPLARPAGALCAVALALLATCVPASSDQLGARQRSLTQSVRSDSDELSADQGREAVLRGRLAGLQRSLAVEQTGLAHTQTRLTAARARLATLEARLAGDRRLLAAQLVAQYEAPTPDLIGVVLESHGFSDLLERVDDMKLIAERNAAVVRRVQRAQAAVAAQTTRLAAARAAEERALAAVLVERDQVATLRLSVLEHERATQRDRTAKQAQLRAVEAQIATLQARAAAAERASFAATSAVARAGPGAAGTPAAPSSGGGEFGFFPAPGTNYSVGEEPAIAARLNALGQALHLRLVGISGYRSPEHSVEVGGFADDPHTRGEASDTPGVEGVPEDVLLRFGLTRPFPGPREADHIQLAP